MRYQDVADYVKAGLKVKGYGLNTKPMPLLDPGPGNDIVMQKLSPVAMVFLTLGDGQGFTTELLYDKPFIRVRAVGPINSYAGGEELAYDVDNVLCATDHNTKVGSALALYITRAGGAPVLLQQDTGLRYHFTCTYITETVSGL